MATGRHTLSLGPSKLQVARSVAAGPPAPTAGYDWGRCWAQDCRRGSPYPVLGKMLKCHVWVQQ